jgi:bifunctional enzyme CysN/CysC
MSSLDAHARKGLLRLITCGSVDDGKSTLLGRLLLETQSILEDQMLVLSADSGRAGAPQGTVDLAWFVDGLMAEREQGITIDVAYRFFSTARRKFIVADTPGHEQYTRNMVTGASTADVAVILIDARKGVLTQSRRHAYLTSLLGVRRLVLAVNKMDLVEYSQARFEAIVADFAAFAGRAQLPPVVAIPVVATAGDNVARPGAEMPWYTGPTLLEFLETVEVGPDGAAQRPFRMPVQWVNRMRDFRGLAGQVTSGQVAVGDRVRVWPAGTESVVARVLTGSDERELAVEGQSTLLVLGNDVDAGRGVVIAAADHPPGVADQFEATVVWLHEAPLLQGRSYWLKLGTQLATVTVAPVKHRVDVNTLEPLAAERLELNDIGVCELALDRDIVFAAYAEDRALGGFLLIDRVTNATVGAGLIHFALRRAANLHRQLLDVDKGVRARQKAQRPRVVWFTGLSGAGKSTVANLLERRLVAAGRHTYLLDGDNVRFGLNRDLGFSAQDRVANVRRIAEVAKLMVDAGLIVLVSVISPFRAERRSARELFEPGEFVEVFVDTPLEVVERRDVKGLYRKARAGQLANFTGIDSPYEVPEAPEVHLRTTETSVEDAAAQLLAWLE